MRYKESIFISADERRAVLWPRAIPPRKACTEWVWLTESQIYLSTLFMCLDQRFGFLLVQNQISSCLENFFFSWVDDALLKANSFLYTIPLNDYKHPPSYFYFLVIFGKATNALVTRGCKVSGPTAFETNRIRSTRFRKDPSNCRTGSSDPFLSGLNINSRLRRILMKPNLNGNITITTLGWRFNHIAKRSDCGIPSKRGNNLC